MTKDFLEAAARAAERAKSVKRAIELAWQTLHTANPLIMRNAFDRWCQTEGMMRDTSGFDVPSLGELLRRRYCKGMPTDIAESLRRAKDENR